MLGKDFIYFVNYTGGGPRASPPAALMKGQDIADTERRSGVRAGTGPAPTPLGKFWVHHIEHPTNKDVTFSVFCILY